jgi:hypothetical protein
MVSQRVELEPGHAKICIKCANFSNNKCTADSPEIYETDFHNGIKATLCSDLESDWDE